MSHLLIAILCAVPVTTAAALFIWALCRAASDTRTVDEGQAFGGDEG